MNHARTDTAHHGASHGHHHEHAIDGQAEILAAAAARPAPHRGPGLRHGRGHLRPPGPLPRGDVTAVDASAEHLQRLRTKACTCGVQESVRTVQADLDDDAWPDLGSPDLVWASASMHHMAHPDRTLRTVHGTLAPGGLFVVVELVGHPCFLPECASGDWPGLGGACPRRSRPLRS